LDDTRVLTNHPLRTKASPNCQSRCGDVVSIVGPTPLKRSTTKKETRFLCWRSKSTSSRLAFGNELRDPTRTYQMCGVVLFRVTGSISICWCTLISFRIVSWCVEVCHIRSSQYARYRNSGRSEVYLQLSFDLLPAASIAGTNARRVRGGYTRDCDKTRRHIRCPLSTCVDEARPECTASASYLSRVCRPSPGNPILLTCDSIPDAIHVLVVAQRKRIETVVD